MDKQEHGRGRWLTWRNVDSFLIRLMMLAAVGFVGFLVYMILSTRTSSTSDSEALVQMAQWTIVTVLTGGAALIGINWYQGEKRYERDREDINREIKQLAQENKGQFAELERKVYATAVFAAMGEMHRRVGKPDDERYIEKCIDAYTEVPEVTIKTVLAEWLIEEARRIESAPVTSPTLQRAAPLFSFLPKLSNDLPDKANELQEVLSSPKLQNANPETNN